MCTRVREHAEGTRVESTSLHHERAYARMREMRERVHAREQHAGRADHVGGVRERESVCPRFYKVGLLRLQDVLQETTTS